MRLMVRLFPLPMHACLLYCVDRQRAVAMRIERSDAPFANAVINEFKVLGRYGHELTRAYCPS
jgi:hypothetical protein